MAKAAPAAKKPLTKSELMANIAAAADVSKKQVAAMLEALAAEIKKSLGSKGAGVIDDLVQEAGCLARLGPFDSIESKLVNFQEVEVAVVPQPLR